MTVGGSAPARLKVWSVARNCGRLGMGAGTVTGRREDRHRIPRALVGFNNALLVTGNQK